MGLRPGDTHLLGPWARVPQLPGPQQHRELGWFVQITRRKRAGVASARNCWVARKGLGRVSGEWHAHEGPWSAKGGLPLVAQW